MLNKAIFTLASAALVEQAFAFNSHRVLHEQIEKRAAYTEMVTVYETVTVRLGQQSPPAATDAAAQFQNNVPATTVVVVAPSQHVEAVAPQYSQQTTLASAVKSAPSYGAPAASSSSAPSSGGSSPSYGSSIFSSKRGIAFNDPKLAAAFGKGCTSCSWSYNWDHSCPGLDGNANFVPMLWDDSELHTNGWVDNANKAIANGAKAILGFNEPDNAGQANMSPARAAASHAKLMNQFSGKVQIGAPSISNSGEQGQGIQWLESFFTECEKLDGGCKVDFCPVHWYSEAQYASTLFDHLEKAHQACGGRPVWLTEFAPTGPADQTASFLKENIPKLEALDYLHAYSYFMVSASSLMTGPDAMSDFGKVYAGL